MEATYEVTIVQPDEDDVRLIDDGELAKAIEKYMQIVSVPFNVVLVERL